MAGSNFGAHQQVIHPFERAANLMDLDKDAREALARPISEVAFDFPARMSGGRSETFAGYWVEHNNLLGPYKGGLCYYPRLDADEVRARARCMTWKSAIADIPLGGAYGGIQIDPARYSAEDLERITRQFCLALDHGLGSADDMPVPAVIMNLQNVASILDSGSPMMSPFGCQRSLHVARGKPLEMGGTISRDQAASQGMVHLIAHWAQDRGLNLHGATYVVQGFGNLGSWTARLLKALGATLVAAEDHTCAVACPDGIDPDDLLSYTATHEGGFAGYPKAKPIAHRSFLSTKADIFILAALEKELTRVTARWLNVNLVAEGTNNPTDLEGDFILQAKGIDLLPDILCTSGGVIYSHLESQQIGRTMSGGDRGVDARLQPIISAAYRRVADAAKLYQTDWRTAAHIVAFTRLLSEDSHGDSINHRARPD